MKCHACKKDIKKADFHFKCDACDTNTCGDCGIDRDTECPKCDAAMDDFNEDNDS